MFFAGSRVLEGLGFRGCIGEASKRHIAARTALIQKNNDLKPIPTRSLTRAPPNADLNTFRGMA